MLSIIYITRNRCAELKESIESCEQHISIEHEYVIVDNGSTDDTEVMLNDLSQKGLKIRYLFQIKNRGVSGGRNIGYEEAAGDILYFIDDDATIISKGLCLDKAYNFMRAHDEVYAMGTEAYDTERKQRLVGCTSKRSIYGYSISRNYIGCSHFIRRGLFGKGKLYPDNLIYGSEELYAGLSIVRFEGLTLLFDDVLVLHRPSKSTRTSREARRREGYINTLLIKHYFLPTAIYVLSILLFAIRSIKSENFNIMQVLKNYKTSAERYDPAYNRKLPFKRIIELSKLYGITKII